jgi:hypothetical protein
MLNQSELIINQHHNDLKREAEQRRLGQMARAAQEPGDPFYFRALAALGRNLSHWGDQLQELYGDIYATDMTRVPRQEKSH